MPAPFAALRRWNRGRSRLTAALVSSPVALGLLVVALLAAGWNYLMAESSRDRVAEASGTVLEIELLFSAIKDLETGERGFVLVGGENYLIPYDEARGALDRGLTRLTTITHGRSEALVVDGQPLVGLIARKRDFAARVVALRKDQGFEAATELVRTGEGKRVMDAIRAEVAVIRAQLSERVDKIQSSDRLRGLLLALLTGATAWGAVALLAWVLLLRHEENRMTGALLEGVLENAPVGLGFLDRDLRLQHRNRALARLGGSGFGTGLGQSIWSALPALEERLSAPLNAALRQGVATPDIAVPVASKTLPGGVRHLRMSFFPLTVPNEAGHPEIEGVGFVVAAGDAGSGLIRAAGCRIEGVHLLLPHVRNVTRSSPHATRRNDPGPGLHCAMVPWADTLFPFQDAVRRRGPSRVGWPNRPDPKRIRPASSRRSNARSAPDDRPPATAL